MGDRPFASLPIAMKRPDGTGIGVLSNIDGFANFAVKLGDKKKAKMYDPGLYEVNALIPDGWISTSDKHKQTLEMLRLPDAPGGMFIAETCRPIGVAPILNVSGRIVDSGEYESSEITISMTDEAGKNFSIPADTRGNFEFIGYPGKWNLQLLDKSGHTIWEVPLQLKNSAIVLSDIDLSKPAPAKSEAEETIVGFDDLVISDSLFEIPFGYNGLKWLNWISVHNRFYSGSGYVNATQSSEYIAYNSSGSPAFIWSDTPFDFVGTNIGMAWPRGEEAEVIFRAWRGDIKVHEDRIRPTRYGGLFFAANYVGITKLEIRSGIYERIALDDFIFRKSEE